MEDSLIRIDAGSGKSLRLTTLRFRVNAFAVSPDRKCVAVAGADQTVHLFDADTLSETASFRAHDGEITALAFHPTGPLIATAAMDHSLKLWDYTSARLLDEFLGLGGTPVVLSFNRSGSLIAVDGQEHTTRIFNSQSATAATSRPATTRDSATGRQVTARPTAAWAQGARPCRRPRRPLDVSMMISDDYRDACPCRD